jgi:polyhydroxyalkanoate synthesis repressor PhaR
MTRLIKKYKNRRLYDTEKSQYITVEELQRYVVEGVAFRVEDSKTNNDITSATLLQIFVEMESGVSKFLTADMLRQLIIIAHHPLNQSFKEMLGQLFAAVKMPPDSNSYLKDYQKITDDWQKSMQDMAKQWQDYFKA